MGYRWIVWKHLWNDHIAQTTYQLVVKTCELNLSLNQPIVENYKQWCWIKTRFWYIGSSLHNYKTISLISYKEMLLIIGIVNRLNKCAHPCYELKTVAKEHEGLIYYVTICNHGSKVGISAIRLSNHTKIMILSVHGRRLTTEKFWLTSRRDKLGYLFKMFAKCQNLIDTCKLLENCMKEKQYIVHLEFA